MPKASRFSFDREKAVRQRRFSLAFAHAPSIRSSALRPLFPLQRDRTYQPLCWRVREFYRLSVLSPWCRPCSWLSYLRLVVLLKIVDADSLLDTASSVFRNGVTPFLLPTEQNYTLKFLKFSIQLRLTSLARRMPYRISARSAQLGADR